MVLRKRGVELLLIVFIFVVIIMILLQDRYVEWAMESAGSAVIGAKVEFDNVHFSPFSLQINWRRLQVTDPNNTWYNLFETKFTNVSIKLEPLFLKRFVIENALTDSLMFNTKRTTSGALPGHAPQSTSLIKRMQNFIKQEEEKTPIIQLARVASINVDSVWKVLNLSTPKVLDSLKADSDDKFKHWKDRFNQYRKNYSFVKLRGQIDSIKVDTIESSAQITETAQKIRSIRSSLDSMKQVYKQSKDSVSEDLKVVSSYNNRIENAVDADVKRARSLAKLPDISSDAITRALVGPELYRRLHVVLTYVGLARYYNEKAQSFFPEKQANPPRLLGQRIAFSNRLNYPSFWIQSSALSTLFYNSILLKGNAQNITTEQYKINLPILLGIGGSEGNLSVDLHGLFDYRKISHEQFVFDAQGIPFNAITFTQSDLFPFSIKNGSGSIETNIGLIGDRLDGLIKLGVNNLQLVENDSFPVTNNQVKKYREIVAASLKTVNLKLNTVITGNSSSFDLTSNAGDIISSALKQSIAPMLDSFEQTIKTKIITEINQPRSKLFDSNSNQNRVLADTLAVIDKEENYIETVLREKEQVIRKKAQNSVTEDIKKRTKDKIKGLLK